MKVLVMSEEKWDTLDDIFYSEREVIALRKAMTTIDIPDGCVLAVARHEGDVMCSNATACDSDCHHKHAHWFDADLCDTAECHDTKVMVKCVPQLRVIQEVKL